jgi:hypothetical protein
LCVWAGRDGRFLSAAATSSELPARWYGLVAQPAPEKAAAATAARTSDANE